MKIVLTALNAKFIHSNLAVRDIACYAQRQGIICHILEFTINQQPDLILRTLFEEQPDLIGFSCYIWNIELIKQLAGELKKVLPKTRILLGGPEVSYNAQQILQQVPADFVLRGEGEASFAQLIGAIPSEDFSKVAGLTYLSEQGIVSNPAAVPLPMEEIPFVYSDLEEFKNRILYYESSRGCPYRCGYCLSSIERGVRFLPLERVFHDLQFFLDHKVRQVKFVDRTFNCNRSHALAIWKFLDEHDNGVTNFHFEINADTLDKESVDFLTTVRRGLFQFEIGIQTTNQQTLGEIHRKNDFDRISQIVRRLQSRQNIHLHLDLIAGLPEEGYESFCKSFNDVYALCPDQFQLGFLKVLKGSDIAHRQQELGIVSRDTAPYEVLFTKELSFKEMLRLKMIEEMVEQYYNSNRYKLCLSYLCTLFPSPFALFESLAEFYHRNNYHFVQHSKAETYTILFEFLKQIGGDSVRFQWLAKHDLFSHEKAKALPAWLDVDLTADLKPQIYAFFHSEELRARYLPEYSGYDPRQVHRMAHLEIFPFNPYTGERQQTAVLFNYKRTDLLGNAHSEIVQLPESIVDNSKG